MNDTINSILSRRSNRGFSEKQLTDEQISLLKECALASPTAMNKQSWHFSFVSDQKVISQVENETLRIIDATADEATKARTNARNRSIFYDAPLVVFISSDPSSRWAHIDAGIAVENLAISAQSLGLGSVIIGLCTMAFEGENKAELSDACGFPEGYKFSIAICIGQPTVSKEAHEIGENKLTIID